MRIRVIAVGSRMPRWVRESFEDYAGRLRSTLKLSLQEIASAPRGSAAAAGAARAISAEGRRQLAALRPDDYVVALDERGSELSTRQLADWLKLRMQGGRDLAILIGGPDGLAPEALARSEFTLSLSRLTFPHALVRVMLAEQLYRAHSVLCNHPYHRD